MAKVTNYDLLKKNMASGGTGRRQTLVEEMDLVDEYIKLRAEGVSFLKIANKWNTTHPKKSGKKWIPINLQQFDYRRRDKIKDIASQDTSVSDAVAKEVINTTKRMGELDTVLQVWLKKANTKGVIRHKCSECEHWEMIEVFDSDKAVRIAAEIRKTLLTQQKLATNLPSGGGGSSNSLGGAMDVKKFIDKMVKENILIVANKDKLSSYGL